MRKIVAALTIMVAVVCLCGSAHTAPLWTDIIEGAEVPGGAGGFYFFSPASGNTCSSVIVDSGTLNRALVLSDLSDDTAQGKALLQRDNWTDGPNGVTLHCRFRVMYSGTDNAIGIQIPEGYSGADEHGHVKWSWAAGVMSLSKGTADAGKPTTFSAPAGTWEEIWLTVSGGRWNIWVKSGSSWSSTPYSQGTLRAGGASPYIGCGSFPDYTSQMQVDFARLYIQGAYGPNDPNAPVLPAATNSIGAAKVTHPLGFPENFTNKMVTNSWTQYVNSSLCNILYMQEDNRSAGVRVQRQIQNLSDAVEVGARVNVKGYYTRAAGEVKAMADDLTIAAAAPVPPVLPRPVWVLGKNASAGKLGLQTPYSSTTIGLNNTGLRVRTSGVVTATGYVDPSTGFVMSYIDDGTGIINDSYYWYLLDTGETYPGIKVYNAEGLNVGDRVAISGSAGIEQYVLDPNVYYPVIYCTDTDVPSIY